MLNPHHREAVDMDTTPNLFNIGKVSLYSGAAFNCLLISIWYGTLL